MGALGGMMQQQSAQTAAQNAEDANMWTQMLMLAQLGKFGQEIDPALAQAMGYTQQASDQLQGTADTVEKGYGQALGALGAAGQASISQIMKNQQAAKANVAQGGVTSGFYGSSINQGQTNTVQGQTNQNVSEVMSQVGAKRADLYQNKTAGLVNAAQMGAQGKKMLADQTMAGLGTKGQFAGAKSNAILNTANAFGMHNPAMLMEMMKQAGGPYGANTYQSGFSDPGSHEYKGDSWQNQDWLQNIWG